MAERTLPFVNVAMWSDGHYSTATKGAKDVIDGATPLVLDAIHHMPETDPARPFTMTDMGCTAARQEERSARDAREDRRMVYGGV